jgi:predicted ATP-grasp superfamily ATP-dependent carboligase
MSVRPLIPKENALPCRVLILDACQRSALAATRSLGSHGLEVITADTRPSTLAGASKFSSRSLQYPDPQIARADFVTSIADIVTKYAVDVVLPMTDMTTMLLVGQRHRLAPARLGCAPLASYESLSDKAALVTLASQLGVPVPRTHTVTNVAEISALAQNLPFPLVLKPSRSRYLFEGQIHSTQVRIAQTPDDLALLASRSDWLAHIPGLIQEYIPGYGAGVFALGDGNKAVAWFSHRRIREKPPSGGVSVLCESVAIDPVIQGHAAKLLEAAGWFGPAMVEFRVAQDGTAYLMEVNGRFWGSLQLSIDSGIDFPWLLYNLLMSQPLPQQSHYKVGQRLRWLLGDFDNLLIQLRGHGGRTSRLTAIADFARTFGDFSARQEIFRWSDSTPGFYELKSWLKALA